MVNTSLYIYNTKSSSSLRAKMYFLQLFFFQMLIDLIRRNSLLGEIYSRQIYLRLNVKLMNVDGFWLFAILLLLKPRQINVNSFIMSFIVTINRNGLSIPPYQTLILDTNSSCSKLHARSFNMYCISSTLLWSIPHFFLLGAFHITLLGTLSNAFHLCVLRWERDVEHFGLVWIGVVLTLTVLPCFICLASRILWETFSGTCNKEIPL